MVSVSTIHRDLVGIADLSVDLVSDGDLDRFESIQDIELQVLERFEVCHKHAMGTVYLGEIQAVVIVDRVTVLDNNEVCVCLSVVFPTQGFEVVPTEPENG